MCIFRVPFDNRIKILDSFFMILNHLISFSSLVQVSDIRWDSLDATTIGPNRLFKLLYSTVSQPYMVINVSFECQKWLILERGLHSLYTFLVLGVSKVCQAQLIQYLCIILILSQRFV
jgi:hypothetical protein